MQGDEGGVERHLSQAMGYGSVGQGNTSRSRAREVRIASGSPLKDTTAFMTCGAIEDNVKATKAGALRVKEFERGCDAICKE